MGQNNLVRIIPIVLLFTDHGLKLRSRHRELDGSIGGDRPGMGDGQRGQAGDGHVARIEIHDCRGPRFVNPQHLDGPVEHTSIHREGQCVGIDGDRCVKFGVNNAHTERLNIIQAAFQAHCDRVIINVAILDDRTGSRRAEHLDATAAAITMQFDPKQGHVAILNQDRQRS